MQIVGFWPHSSANQLHRKELDVLEKKAAAELKSWPRSHFTQLTDTRQMLTLSLVFMKQNEKTPSFLLEGKLITMPYSESVSAPLSLGLETTASSQLQFYKHLHCLRVLQ